MTRYVLKKQEKNLHIKLAIQYNHVPTCMIRPTVTVSDESVTTAEVKVGNQVIAKNLPALLLAGSFQSKAAHMTMGAMEIV